MNLHEIDHPSGQKLTVYEIPGPSESAPVIMLLHGLGASVWLNWKPIIEMLAQDYRVLGIDHRGHGRGLDSNSFCFEDCADDIAIAIDAMEIDRVIVAGYSMGGPIALQLWRRHPAKVSGMLLIASATSLTHLRTPKYYLALPVLTLVSVFFTLSRSAYVKRCVKLMQELFPNVFTDEELVSEFRGHRPMVLLKAIVCTTGFEIEWGSEIDVPLIALVPMEDDVVPPMLQRKTAAEAVKGTAIDIPGGHQSILSQPDEFCLSFLEACRKLQSLQRI